MEKQSNLINGCLTIIPSTDGNFISALGSATDEELQQAISIMENRDGKDKSRITACKRELKRRLRKSGGAS